MTAANGTIDLFAKLGKKQEAATPPTQEQIANEPALGVNPPMPEGTPPAPPVGTVEPKPAKTRGRPKKAKPEAAVETVATADPAVIVPAPAFDEAGFDTAWNELGAAVKKYLKAVAS